MSLVVKNPPANAGDIRYVDLIPGSGRSPEGGHGNSLQYSCLENSMDSATWQGTQSIGSQRVGHDWSDLARTCALYKRLRMISFRVTSKLPFVQRSRPYLVILNSNIPFSKPMLHHVRAFYFSLSCLSEQLLNGKNFNHLKNYF